MSVAITEGYAPYSVPTAGKPCQTFYKIFGDVASGTTPLIVLHGGPGCSHLYISSIKDLAYKYAIPVVFYDQVGGGRSTRLPEKAGDTDFWTVRFFVDEFHNLLKYLNITKYDVLGHSWGAMLGMEIGVRQPSGLRRLVLSSGPASMVLWEEVTGKLLETLPKDVQETIRKNEQAGTFDSEEYQEAMQVFNKQYLCRLDPLPQEVADDFAELDKDTTVYRTMQGPSEFTITGSLKTWSVIPELHKINVSVLATNGAYDEAQDAVIAPIFKHVSKVKWYTFSQSAHLAPWEEREKFMQVVGNFLVQ